MQTSTGYRAASRAILCLFVAALASYVVAADATAPVLPERGLCAHRGDWTAAPENTVPAYVDAARAGAQQVEFDVKRTSDGKLVLMHDGTVDRTTNGSGKVRDLTFDEIRALTVKAPDGSPYDNVKVPTFEEALDALPLNIWINAHFEDNEDVVAQAAKIVVEKNRQHQVFYAVGKKGMDAVRKVCPEAKICCMQRETGNVSLYVQHAIDWKCDFIQLNEPYTAEHIAALKKAGVKINYFGTDDPEKIRQLLKDGIDFPLVNYFSKAWPVAAEFDGFKLNDPGKDYNVISGPMLPLKLVERGLCAHRGDQGLAPENTIPAFVAAVEAGAQQVEFDVQLTKDGQLIIMHDETVDRTTTGKGAVKDLTFDEIRSFDAGVKTDAKFAGTKVPTFEEALDCLPRNIIVNIHVKPGVVGTAKATTQIVVAKKRQAQAFIGCETKEDLDEARSVCPDIMIGWLTGARGAKLKEVIQKAIDWKCQFIQFQGYDQEDVAKLKAAGIKINFFGTDDPDKIRQLLNDGIDFPLVNFFSADWPVAKEIEGLELTPRDPSYEGASED